MKRSGFKFDIEKIADTIVEHVDELMTETPLIAHDIDILQRQFHKVVELQKYLGSQSIDFVIVWEPKNWFSAFDKDKYKEEIAEIHRRINFKLTESSKISTFFRGKVAEAPAFHFPASMNIWFLTAKQFVHSKTTPIVVMNLGVQGINSHFTEEQFGKKLFDRMHYYFVEVNEHFDMDKHIEENWADNKKEMSLDQLDDIDAKAKRLRKQRGNE